MVKGSYVDEISDVLKRYGEEKYAYRIALLIKKSIEDKTLRTTLDLSKIIDTCYPKNKSRKKNTATKAFKQ